MKIKTTPRTAEEEARWIEFIDQLTGVSQLVKEITAIPGTDNPGAIECPLCGGTILYRVNPCGSQRHAHAVCLTGNCISFRE